MQRSPEIHVHAIVDSLSFGGAELLLGDMAAVAPGAGLRLSVGFLHEADGSPAATRLRAVGVEPVLIGIPAHLYPSALWRVVVHLRRVAPDVVHTHLGYSDLLGGLAARLLGIPVVSTVHEMSLPLTAETPLVERVKARMINAVRRQCAAKVVAVSEGARRSYVERTGERPDHVVAVHNGVARSPEPGAGVAVREGLGVAPDAIVVATLSTLRPVKAHDVAIEAIALLSARHPSLRFLIVGEGPSRAEVERAARSLGDIVTLTGFRDDTMAVLDAVDVLVHPSHLEALPTTLIEAMAAGVPVVATAVGGVPEIVADGITGLLVQPPPRAEAVAEALERLLDDPEVRDEMGRAGAERFARLFAGAMWAAHLRTVYEAAIDAQGEPARARFLIPGGR